MTLLCLSIQELGRDLKLINFKTVFYLIFFIDLLLKNELLMSSSIYNESQIRTRNTVERQIGVWKMRFPILAYGCCLKLDTAMEVIVATGMLCNICIENNEPEPPPPEDVELLQNIMQQDEVPNIPLHNEAINNILHVQRHFIDNYFAHIEE